MKFTGILIDTLLFWRKDNAPRNEVGSVVGLLLVQAKTGTVVADLMRNGTTVYFNDTKLDLTLRAMTSTSLTPKREVRFDMDGKTNVQTERVAPYTLCGGDFKACSSLTVGSHTVSALTVDNKKAFTVQFNLVKGFAPGATTLSPTPGLRRVTKAPAVLVPVVPTSSPVATAPSASPTVSTPLPTTAATRSNTATPTFPWTEIPTSSPSRSPATAAPVRKKRRTSAPTKKPTKAPTKKPTKAPVKKPTKAPVKKPTKAPTKKPTNAPVRRKRTKAPIKVPVKVTLAPVRPNSPLSTPTAMVPVALPTKAPAAPVQTDPLPSPVVTPVDVPIVAPTPVATPIVDSTPVATATLMPVANTPAPVSPQPVSAAPVSSQTISAAPVSSQPVSAAPIPAGTTAAPVSLTLAPTTLAPTMLQTPQASITMAPTTYATVQTLAPVTKAPIPFGKTVGPAFPTNIPISVTRVPVTKAPLATKAPVTKAPTKAPVTNAPVTKAPVPLPTMAPSTRAPKTMAPLAAGTTQTPTMPPVSPAPVSPAPVSPAPTKAPVTPAPVIVPTNAPVTPAPVIVPTAAPIAIVTPAPVTPAPVIATTAAPIAIVTPAPVAVVTPAPVTPVPVVVPTLAPVTPAPVVAPTKAPVVLPTKAPKTGGFQPILIDCGSDEEYTDEQGRMWKELDYFDGGMIFSVDKPILGSNNLPLKDYEMYHTQRFGNYKYNVPVPDGEYSVRFLLAETYFERNNGRVFDLNVEGTMIKDIDMFKITNKLYKICDKTVEVMVTDGKLTIEVISKEDWGSVGGIEIHRIGDAAPVPAPVAPVPTPAPGFTTIRIACGRDESYEDSKGQVWSKDMHFNQGNPYFAPWNVIADTDDQPLFQGERWGVFDYKIAVPNGAYTVTLFFAEIYHNLIGDRVFNIVVEDFARDNFDIVEEAGGPKTAVSMEATVIVKDGILNLDFKGGKKDNPKLSAIEVKALDEGRV